MTTLHESLHESVQRERPAGVGADVDWSAFAKHMPIGKDAASVSTRRRFFSTCDVNGNGLVSLAEYDRGLRTFIG